jgi:THO complex subunit 7
MSANLVDGKKTIFIYFYFNSQNFFSDEQIIKRRLLIDGFGVGEDRRINMLLKTFIKFCDSKDQIMPLSSQLSLTEFAILKSELSEQMIESELKNYKKISDNIEERIEQVKEDIEKYKEQLVVAKEIRRNKLEYSSLARLIKEQPDRKEIILKHESLKAELQKQVEEFQKISKTLESRSKNFACFMLLLNELLCDEDKDEAENMDADEEVEALIDDNDIESMIIE